MTTEQVIQKLKEAGTPDAGIKIVLETPELLKRFAFLNALQETGNALADDLTLTEKEAVKDLSSVLLKEFNKRYSLQCDIIEQRLYN